MTLDPDRLTGFQAAATAAAELTFEQFRDEPDSDYYQAPGRTPEQTWQEVRERVGLVAADAVALALRDATLTPEVFVEWHRHIFMTTFPDDAGRVRSGRGLTTYGYVAGIKDAPVNKTGRGTAARKLPRRLRKVCEEFNRAAGEAEAAESSQLIDATLPAARLYAKLLSAHPFNDGNGRVSYVALQFALVRLGALFVSLPDYAEQQWHLGRALRAGGGQSYEPLAIYLAQRIQGAGAKGLQSEES
jgi:fido (protein-threonine AMPylation protein)